MGLQGCNSLLLRHRWETSVVIQWSRILLAMQIQFLVGELRSHEPWHGQKKKKVGGKEATGAVETEGTSGSERSKLELSN